VSSNEPFREKKSAGDTTKLIDRPVLKPTVFCVEIWLEILFWLPAKKQARIHFFSSYSSGRVGSIEKPNTILWSALTDVCISAGSTEHYRPHWVLNLPVDNEGIYQGFINVIGITQFALKTYSTKALFRIIGVMESALESSINDKPAILGGGLGIFTKKKKVISFLLKKTWFSVFQHWQSQFWPTCYDSHKVDRLTPFMFTI